MPLVAAILGGVAAGAFARLLDSALPAPWNTLANPSALWGLLPFAAVTALRLRGWPAASVGAAALVSMVTAWIVLAPSPASGREVVLWGVVGVFAGALCGLAGDLVRRSAPWFHRVGLAFMGGVVLGEALYGILLIGGPQWLVEGAIGLALPLALGRRANDRIAGGAGAVLVAAALFAVYFAYDAIAAA